MQTEKDTLTIGVDFDGQIHREIEIRPQMVRDTVEVFEDPDVAARAARNNQYFAACLFAGRLVRLGDIPKEAITVDMLLDMRQEDYDVIIKAAGRLDERETTFRGETAPVATKGVGSAEGGV